ncbi:MAG TPA: chemotaxis protein CheW [Myxococcaceae bacterium]|nr:chemotaxis protein CheW [Myxococcaceae bacterium]
MSPGTSAVHELLARFRYRPEEEFDALVDLPTSSVEPDRPVGAEEIQLLTFSLREGEYAVALDTVTEILRARPLTEIPRARPPLLGVLNLRGTITPVYDPSLRLQLAGSAPLCAGPDCERPPRPARILVVRTALGPAGLWVDRVRGVQRVRPGALERPSSGPTGGVVGILQTAEATCTVVDPEWLLR